MGLGLEKTHVALQVYQVLLAHVLLQRLVDEAPPLVHSLVLILVFLLFVRLLSFFYSSVFSFFFSSSFLVVKLDWCLCMAKIEM